MSTRSLAQIAVERGLVPKIAHSTVSLLLRAADLQPHRSRDWKTPKLDAAFLKRAARILWCYENALVLATKREVVLCVDEKPNIQVLERRCRTQPMRSGQIERQEFEYIRHGTVNFLVALVVPTGKMRGFCLARNDGEHLRDSELAGVQRALRPPARVVADAAEDASMGRSTCPATMLKDLSNAPPVQLPFPAR